jgi:hypothetical protein
MKTETLIKFYNDNKPEQVQDYLDKVIDNIKEVSEMVFRYFMYLILILFVYYLLAESELKNVTIGIVEITNLKVVTIFTPPVFAIIYLIVFIGEYRREDLMHQAKVLFNMLHKTNLGADDLERHHFNDFNISFLPFYLPTELNHKLGTKGLWNFLVIFLLALFYLTLSLALYVFEYYILKNLFALWDDSLLVKSVFVLTSALVFISFILFFMIAFKKQRETKDDKEFWTTLARERNRLK